MTLIEIIVVVAIVAVLTALALPSYRHYVQRGHRAEAVRTLHEMAACQEGVRAETGYYDTRRCQAGAGDGYYRFSISPAGQPDSLSYELTATPVQTDAGDSCGSLSLNHQGTRGVSGDPAAVAACWGGR